MSWSAEWMKDWLDAGERSQLDLALLADVDPANVSRWLRSQSRPDRHAVAKLAETLPQMEAAQFICAWLRDIMPKHAQQLVEVRVIPTGEDGDSIPQEFPEGISAELRKRLIFFSKLAVRNPEVRNFIGVCYKAAKSAETDRFAESK